jgi:hypothetical protein
MCGVIPEGSNVCMCFHRQVEVDERWMGEWVAYGFQEMGVYLHKVAKFEAYYKRTREQVPA